MTDIGSIGALLHALYDTISGPAGTERDWTRFRSLFTPGARLIRTSVGPDGTPQAKAMEVHQYEADVTTYFQGKSFYEAEIARRVDVFGNVAHVFSTYEARHNPDDTEPFKRGINSIQLFYDGERWLVVNMLWDNERPDNPIPAEYLPGD